MLVITKLLTQSLRNRSDRLVNRRYEHPAGTASNSDLFINSFEMATIRGFPYVDAFCRILQISTCRILQNDKSLKHEFGSI